MKTNAVAQALSSVVVGPEVVFQNLTMLPLLTRAASCEPRAAASVSVDYIVLDDALASGAAEITEVSEQGSVPDLKVVNRGALPVLIIDGEELTGARQNRVVNLTILVPAHSEVTIPVSCVEAGRWRARSHAFASAARVQYATGRARRMKDVTESIRDRGDRMSDQAGVWADIAQKSARLSVSSPTSAMEALFTGRAEPIDAVVAACPPVEGQRGAVFAVNGVVIGFDLFDRESTLRKVLPKLVRSVALDALDMEIGAIDSAHALPIRAACDLFLAAVASAPQHRAKGIGMGDDVRLTAAGLAGAGLVVDGAVVHISAFSEGAEI